MLSSQLIKKRALELGFDLVGIAPLPPPEIAEFTRQWLEKGYAGEMRYLWNPLREHPRRLLPSVRSAVCVGLNYNTPFPYSTECGPARTNAQSSESPAEDAGRPAGPRAWISRYAWGRDYHGLMRERLERLRQAIQAVAPAAETRIYVDTGPVNERALARLSGIGWMGKNTLIINERQGSWFFLGVVLTDLDLTPDSPAPDRCGSCTRCLDACPTQALVQPYVMDASRCISYFTIELKGATPEEFRPAIGRNVFGCDICQDVCPWNSSHPSNVAETLPRGRAAVSEFADFHPLEVHTARSPERSGARKFSLFNPALESLVTLADDDVHSLLKNSPIRRAKYRGWLRNLCVAVGNAQSQRFLPWLTRMTEHHDPLIAEHAAWALRQVTARR